ncbi:MAG TPA: hypothetical protein IGS53_22895 [Leptolyngbyaceae cyanobacterium M33_DOE_097]|uniref:Uncharacterized protein n=1 Tax=Oscillatoriales cyanobacterium SpSt-418 TaxID=2282169 RepID=A0A7C3KDV1_9CYAN|nr:hypothetical protein [Leptolyngbyaceae cyanobacterium M33_DOE_097]
MSNASESRQAIPIATDFFCDGHYYVLTSASFGGSGLTPDELANTLASADAAEIETLLSRGVCIPLVFDGDCALDNNTLIVLGDLTEKEEHDWIGRLAWKLNIPCGKFIIQCGGGDAEELAYAISGQPPKPNYQIFQVIEVPPGEYLVEIYAYLASMTVQLSLEEYDENWNLKENDALREWYQSNRPGFDELGYIIRLVPLEVKPPLPSLVPEIGWCGVFELRQPQL